ncbi:SulP family inorganic anion transporter [Paraburkholderia sp. BR10882]|uniref:SulP family inorganic anion transporter n=1 Tax=unclassified Paraburkholderia TaxID=2615204 RepID=UPI0034CF13FC
MSENDNLVQPYPDPRARRTLRGQRALTSLSADTFAGLLTALVALSYAAGYGAMIFSAGLSPWLASGMPTALTSCVIVAFVVSLASSQSFMIAGPDSNGTALLASLAAATALSVHAAGGSDGAVLSTVLLLIAVSSVTTGALLLVLANWKRGNVIQYVPFPVIGGFLAGTGLLLVEGALRVFTDVPLGAEMPRALMQLPWLATVPALFVSVALLVLTRLMPSSRYVIVLPAILTLGVAVFYIGLIVSGRSIEDAQRMGLLFQYKPIATVQLPFSLVHQARLPALASSAPEILAIAAVSSMTVLLNTTSIGVATGHDIDYTREMRAVGLANIVTGAVGGLVGAQSMTRTMIHWRLGVRRRRAGVLAAVFSFVAVAFYPGLMAILPKPVLVGLQLFVGATMLTEWLVDSFRRLPWHDYLLIPAIMVCVAAYGIVAGVVLGVIAACLLFVVRYGHVNCLRLEFDGRGRRSNLERTIEENRVLDAEAQALYGVALQGFLFFGTAHAILAHIRARIEVPTATAHAHAGVRLVLVDFARVHGVDASCIASFERLRDACARVNAKLVLTGLSPALRKWFADGVTDPQNPSGPYYSTDLDSGLEWIETQLLGAAHVTGTSASVLDLPDTLHALRPHLDTLSLARGEYVFRQADPSDAIYFVQSGRVTVALPGGEGRMLRLRSFGAGTIVGEMGAYTGARRSADVVADEPTVVLRLAISTLRRIDIDDPALAGRMHMFVARVLATRLAVADEQIRVAQ